MPKSKKKEAKKKVVKNVVEEVKQVETPVEEIDNHSPDYSWIAIAPEKSEKQDEEAVNFKALKEEAELNELKAIEEATNKMQQAVVKQRKRKPVTLKITGDTLLRWYAMIDGMRTSLLNRAGVTAAEKAVYSKVPINDATALEYLLTLHDEEVERRDDTKRVIARPERAPQTPEDAMLAQAQQKRSALDSQNPQSMLSQSPPPIIPKMGALFKDEGFTVGGSQMSEAEFFRVAASKKPPKKTKKGM
jgi:hypothetical protein